MRRTSLAGLVVATSLVCLAAGAQESPTSAQSSTLSLDEVPTLQLSGLTDQVIRKAVRDTVAESPQAVTKPAAHQEANDASAFSAARSSRIMAAAFDEAKVPDCLHGDALKHQPAKIGVVAVVGQYALPWVIAAALRGKCN